MKSGTTSLPVTIPAEPLDLRYPGGKGLSGIHQWICSHLPTHVWYAEPFAGHGGIFRNKIPALRTWLIDLDPEVITWWHRQQQRERQPSNPGTIVDAADGIHKRHRQRGSIEILHGCGIRWVELAAEWQIPELLVYLDPPYLPETRVRQNLYRHEMTRDDHFRLLTAAVNIRGPVVVSGYSSPMYHDILSQASGWSLETRWVITRGGTLREECLWKNQHCARASSTLSMKYSELGGDFRERERINRKRQRWVANYRTLPERERRAILLDLLDCERLAKKR
ncbi:MAG: hypothetical protein WCH39_08440 [Schlesneria sp.]